VVRAALAVTGPVIVGQAEIAPAWRGHRPEARAESDRIVIKDLGVKRELPLDKAVTVAVKADRKGKLRYACPMDMIAGDIVVD
jgi:plastocyanin domain-containing protein